MLFDHSSSFYCIENYKGTKFGYLKIRGSSVSCIYMGHSRNPICLNNSPCVNVRFQQAIWNISSRLYFMFRGVANRSDQYHKHHLQRYNEQILKLKANQIYDRGC